MDQLLCLWVMEMVEGRFFVSSRECCPAYRRGHWRVALWAHCVSAFVCACLCSLLVK